VENGGRLELLGARAGSCGLRGEAASSITNSPRTTTVSCTDLDLRELERKEQARSASGASARTE
jgi:hypothetical protein